MPKKNFLLFFLYLAVFDFVYNDLKKWRKANSTTHGVWLAPGFQSQRGCVLPSLSIILTQVQIPIGSPSSACLCSAALMIQSETFSNCLPIFYTLQRFKTES